MASLSLLNLDKTFRQLTEIVCNGHNKHNMCLIEANQLFFCSSEDRKR